MTQSTKEWTITTLGEVSDLQKGMMITAKSAQAGQVPVIAGGKTPAYFHSESNRPSKTITVSASGAYAGYVAFHSGPIWASDCVTAVPKSDQGCTPEFLYYFMLSRQNEIYGLQRGSGMPHVYAKDLALLEMALPVLEVQNRIVETLNEHLSRLDKALLEVGEAKVDLLTLERAILHESFTSDVDELEKVDFKDFFSVVQPKYEGYKQKDYKIKGTLPIIDQGSALVGGYVNETTRRISVQKPLVIFGDHTRCVKYVDFDFAMGADGTKMLEPRENVDSKFAYLQLRGKELRNRGYARHMSELRKERFWLPAMDTQSEVTQKVERAFEHSKALREQIEAQERAVDVLRRSLLHAALSGKMKGSKSNG